MNLGTQKNTVVSVSLLLSLTLTCATKAAAPAQPARLVEQLLNIKKRTVEASTRPTPEELDKQINTGISELTKANTVHEELINELLAVALETSQHSEQLKADLERNNLKLSNYVSLIPANATKKEIRQILKSEIAALPYATKERVINAIALESKGVMFESIGERIFESKRPFEIPADVKDLSQLDWFLLLSLALTVEEANRDAANKDNWILFHNACMSCVGLKDVLKFQARLNKPQIIGLMPESVKKKFFAKHNPATLLWLAQHVKGLATATNK